MIQQHCVDDDDYDYDASGTLCPLEGRLVVKDEDVINVVEGVGSWEECGNYQRDSGKLKISQGKFVGWIRTALSGPGLERSHRANS